MKKNEDNNEELTNEYESGTAKLFNIISEVMFYILIVVIIIGALMFANSRTEGKTLFGFGVYDILTASMTPTYSVGDMVIVRATDTADINVGDVITFTSGSDDSTYLTHRVIEKLDNYQGTGVTCFRTKGDANDSDDPFVIDETKVVGVVKLSIPIIGIIVLFIQNNYIFTIAFAVALYVLFTLIRKYMEASDEVKAIENGEAVSIDDSEE